jgi:hypothetical protein
MRGRGRVPIGIVAILLSGVYLMTARVYVEGSLVCAGYLNDVRWVSRKPLGNTTSVCAIR